MERELIQYLRGALPTADQIELSDEFLMKIVRHAQRTRNEMPWGEKIPEWIFRAFVLFPRVNDERPTFYQETIHGELAARLKGLSMAEAAQEVNRWACERATYQSTDDRTADALTVLRRTFGRCGEESTLLVSALRSVCIPARQVYAPRWSRCDDNHAWVEVWVDGVWHYLGACEPEPVMDSGWFTASASEAMLVHTRAYGVKPEGERVEGKIGSAYIINCTAAYAKTRLLTVKVTENGLPKPGAIVRFEIANMAELHAINEQTTDDDGKVSLLTGLGTMNLHVHDTKRYLRCSVDVETCDSVTLDFANAMELEHASTFSQRAPRGTKIQPSQFSQETLRAHAAMLKECERLRAERIASFPKSDPDVAKALGNHAEIEMFLANSRFEEADKRALLGTLTDKDFGDVTADTLSDALSGALPFKTSYPESIWREGVLRPRIWNEPLSPARAVLRTAFSANSAQSLWNMMRDAIELCEMTPVTLTPDLRAMVRAKRASEAALDVLYVAAARANGIAARLNPVSMEKEIWDGQWKSLLPTRKADAKLVLVEKSGRELVYGVHFTVGVKRGGAFHTLNLYGASLKGRLEIPVFAGKYRVTVCARQIDGAYDGTITTAVVRSGEERQIEVHLPEDRSAQLVQCTKLPKLAAGTKLLPEEGRPAIIAQIAPGQEPTEHFLNELLEAKDAISESGAAIHLLADAGFENVKLQTTLREIESSELLMHPDAATLLDWRALLNAGELRLPLVVAVDAAGNGRFAIANYNVGSVLSMLHAIGVKET